MKKIFQLHLSNKDDARTLEAIKSEVRKYLKRERKKNLPKDATFWDFDCKFGQNDTSVEAIGSTEIISKIDFASEQKWDSFYLEIFSKAITKKKAEVESEEELETESE
jgi:hypothetical protein